MKNYFFLAALFWAATSVYSAEISVFDAGNLNKENPYGLTESEKILLKNKQKVDRLNQNIGSVQSDLSNVQEGVDGLRSVADGLNQANQRLESKFSDLQNKFSVNEANFENEINELKAAILQNKIKQEEDYKKLTKAIDALSKLIDSANSVRTDSISQSNKDDLNNKKPSVVLKEADEAYDRKDYAKAKAYYLHLIEKKHKPAYSNFKVAEILYFEKSYQEAIPYYQKSVKLYDKAAYMPKLLYHVAISFDKIGDRQSADKFYIALKQNYPDSQEAKVSPNRN